MEQAETVDSNMPPTEEQQRQTSTEEQQVEQPQVDQPQVDQPQVEQPPAEPAPPDEPFTMDTAMEHMRILIAKVEELQNANTELAAANYSLEDHQIPALQEENQALTAQRIVHLREIDELKEDFTSQRNRRLKTETELDALKVNIERLEAYLGFARLTFSDEDHISLEGTVTAIKRQILAQGLTQLEAAEQLHHGIRSLPEENTLGDYVEFLTNHLNEDKSGVYALRKTMLLQHQKRIAEYLAAMGCFYCNCGRCLNDHIRNRSMDLFHLCPRCLATPYCDITCATRYQAIHALVCNTHPAWKSDDQRPINYCGFVPLITSALKPARTLPSYPPILNPSPTTFGETAITIMSGTERHWTQSKQGVISLTQQGWKPIKTTGTTVKKWSHEATGKVVWVIDEALPRIHYVNVNRPLEHVNPRDELVVYTQAVYDNMRDKHSTNLEQMEQIRLQREAAKKKAIDDKKLLALAAKSILHPNRIPKKRKTEVPEVSDADAVHEETTDERKKGAQGTQKG